MLKFVGFFCVLLFAMLFLTGCIQQPAAEVDCGTAVIENDVDLPFAGTAEYNCLMEKMNSCERAKADFSYIRYGNEALKTAFTILGPGEQGSCRVSIKLENIPLEDLNGMEAICNYTYSDLEEVINARSTIFTIYFIKPEKCEGNLADHVKSEIDEMQEWQSTLNSEMRKAEVKQAKAACQSMCKCETEQQKAGFCLHLAESPTYGVGKVDFTYDGSVDDYAEPAETAGLYGLCENRVYCSQLSSCTCGNQELTMKNCFELICQAWKAEGLDEAEIAEKIGQFFPEPSCEMSEEERENHWRSVYSSEMQCK